MLLFLVPLGSASPESPTKSEAAGFSARILPQSLGRQSPTETSAPSPDSSTKTKTVGFSARNLPQGAGFSASSKSPGFPPRARANSDSSDAKPGPTVMPCGTPEVEATGAVNQSSPKSVPEQQIGFGARKLEAFKTTSDEITEKYESPKVDFATKSPSPTKMDFAVKSPSAEKIDFAIKSPSSSALPKLGVSARTKRAINTKTAARKEWRNSNRPGLSSPTFSDSSVASDAETKSGPTTDPCGTPANNEEESTKLSPKTGFSAISPPPGFAVGTTADPKLGPTADPCGTPGEEGNPRQSPVVGFSARNPPPGLGLGRIM